MAENAEVLSEAATSEETSIEQLREILFGQQKRENESRIQRLEESITEQQQNLQALIEHEISSLRSELLKTEENARSTAIGELADRIDSALERLSMQAEEQQAALATEISELRQQLDTTDHELQTLFKENQQQLEERLDNQLAELDREKITKSTLSELLLTLADGVKKG